MSKYFINDREVSRVEFFTSIEDGVRKLCRDDGSIQSTSSYLNGKQHGVERYYDIYGFLREEAPIRNGQTHGVVRGYYRGESKWEVSYKNDEAHGIERSAPDWISWLWYRGEKLGRLDVVLQEKGKLWLLIAFGSKVLREADKILRTYDE